MTQKIKKKTTGLTLTDECLEAIENYLSSPKAKFTSRSGMVHYLVMDFIAREERDLNNQKALKSN